MASCFGLTNLAFDKINLAHAQWALYSELCSTVPLVYYVTVAEPWAHLWLTDTGDTEYTDVTCTYRDSVNELSQHALYHRI